MSIKSSTRSKRSKYDQSKEVSKQDLNLPHDYSVIQGDQQIVKEEKNDHSVSLIGLEKELQNVDKNSSK